MKSMTCLIWFGLLICLFLSASCELKRNNPLDPEGNINVHVPPQVIGLAASASPPNAMSKYVQLTWNRNLTNTTGYFIYMSLAYNAAFVKEGYTGNIPLNPEDQAITFIKTGMEPGDYYFKVSAFKYYGHADPPPNPMDDNSDYLEGQLSDWVYVRVPN